MNPAADDTDCFRCPRSCFPAARWRCASSNRAIWLVRDCTRAGRPFGVTLLLRGQESGETTTALAIGTLARIVDFNTLPDGLLGIRCSGEQRFHVDHASARPDGLLIGRLSLWDDEPKAPLPPEFFLLSRLAQGLVENLIRGRAGTDQGPLDPRLLIGFRLAELLPFALGEKQQLLD